jgi:spore germination protein YaaH
MKSLSLVKKLLYLMPVLCMVCLSAAPIGRAAPAAGTVMKKAPRMASKADDPVFSVPAVDNPIQPQEVKDFAIAEQNGRWLVAGRALSRYGLYEVPRKAGYYRVTLPEPLGGMAGPVFQDRQVELLLPGTKSADGYMVSLRHIRRPLGISYVLHDDDTKELQLPLQPVRERPILKTQPLPEAGDKKAKTGAVILWDPKMREDALIPSLKARIPVISPCAFSISEHGLLLKHPDFDTYVSRYQEKGYQIWPLVDNQFDSALTHRILKNPKLRDQIIKELIGYASLYGLSGYNLDFEDIEYADKADLTRFVEDISVAAKAYGLTISMDVTVYSSSPNWSLVYDRPALGKALDYVVVMAYDEYSRNSSVAGPVASYPWVEAGIKRFVTEVAPDKIILGMPFYMRIWHERKGDTLPSLSTTWHPGTTSLYTFFKPDQLPTRNHLDVRTLSLSDSAALMERFKSNIQWNDHLKLYYLSLPLSTGTVKIWFEDEKSLHQKMALVAENHLGGAAFWRKDFEDPSFWTGFGKRELT